LAEFGVTNVGAAGTYVVRAAISQSKLRNEILRPLKFKPELMICPARDVIALAESDPFQKAPPEGDTRRFVSVMDKAPRKLPPFPLEQPAGSAWQVRIINVRGRFALSLWRRLGRSIVYPNAAVEKHLSARATTRSWNTVSRICKLLAKSC
jgi:uncharacterized protein (DUF1697 family)